LFYTQQKSCNNITIMALIPYSLARPFLFGLDPETAHDLTLNTISKLQNTPAQCTWAQEHISDPIELAGIRFPNRIGLAAGLDKNGRCIDGLGAMGFGFIEVGTVTPLPQDGNPKPRIFRIPARQALINRLGFNNDGLDAFLNNVKKAKRFQQTGGVLGLNIGKNAQTPIERAADDYLLGLNGVFPYADYITVNISSPNTQNLRQLQEDQALDTLLGSLMERKSQLSTELNRNVPLFLKIAPDLSADQISRMAHLLLAHCIDGFVATNTTVSREQINGLPHAQETGGLSGSPVLQASNRVISQLRSALGPNFPIIGVGGVMSANDAMSKIEAGADLVQIYTGLIYHGPALIPQCAKAIRTSKNF
jgi:dihydroorotate dehydrogenase